MNWWHNRPTKLPLFAASTQIPNDCLHLLALPSTPSKDSPLKAETSLLTFLLLHSFLFQEGDLIDLQPFDWLKIMSNLACLCQSSLLRCSLPASWEIRIESINLELLHWAICWWMLLLVDEDRLLYYFACFAQVPRLGRQ